jgi:tetratricopeptide (TPR) repeat protein
LKRRLLSIGLVQVGVLLWAAATLSAQSTGDAEAMAASNNLYESGLYVEAAQVYQQLVDQGHRNGALYYNLGNAYYKQGDLGRAILNYRRAERLVPRDSDVRANLELARSQTVDLIDRAESAFLIQGLVAAQAWLTLNEVAVVSFAMWVLLVALLLGVMYGPPGRLRRGSLYASLAVGIVLIAAAASLAGRTYDRRSHHDVVVLAQEVDVLSGPDPQYVTEFTLHSGAEVRLIEKRGNWARITLPAGELQGWVPAGAVAEP